LFDEIEALKQGREIVYGYLGVTVSTPTPRQRKEAGVRPEVGVSVDSIEKNSPASDVLLANDMILGINNETIADADQFASTIGVTPIDHPTKLAIVRDGKSMLVSVTLKRRVNTAVAVTRDTQRYRWRGLVLGPIPGNWDFGKSKRPDCGMMVLGVSANSPLASKVTVGSIVTAIAGKPLREIQDLQAILNDTPSENCNIELAGGSEPQVAAMKE
jgi:S1-C subfamily serine protease